MFPRPPDIFPQRWPQLSVSSDSEPESSVMVADPSSAVSQQDNGPGAGGPADTLRYTRAAKKRRERGVDRLKTGAGLTVKAERSTDGAAVEQAADQSIIEDMMPDSANTSAARRKEEEEPRGVQLEMKAGPPAQQNRLAVQSRRPCRTNLEVKISAPTNTPIRRTVADESFTVETDSHAETPPFATDTAVASRDSVSERPLSPVIVFDNNYNNAAMKAPDVKLSRERGFLEEPQWRRGRGLFRRSGRDEKLLGWDTASWKSNSLEQPSSFNSSRRSSRSQAGGAGPTLHVPLSEFKMTSLSPLPMHSPSSALSLYSYSTRSAMSESSTIFGPDREHILGEKIRVIVDAFRTRASKVKKRLEQPPTPTMDTSEDEETATSVKRPQLILEDFGDSLYGSRSSIPQDLAKGFSLTNCIKRMQFIDPRGYLNIGWLSVMTACFLYNAWVIPFRFFFPEYQTEDNLLLWFLFDYICDFFYLMDILLFKYRVMYMENGFWVKDRKKLIRQYVRKGTFKLDVLSLLPLDILYLKLGTGATLLRLPRLLKYGDFLQFFTRLDASTSQLQYVVRLVKTVIYMLYLIHLNACAYFAISYYQGLGSNNFVFDGVGSSYIRCFYFATKTATSIGKNKKPTNIPEIIFMTCSWMMGVFVFAILIGNIRDILGTAMRNKNEYRKKLDSVSHYMQKFKVPGVVQHRVKLWMAYTWNQQKSFNEEKVLSFLPLKMRTDLALQIHYKTLSKVKLFQDCDSGLLKELVVKLKPVVYLPGDYICRKGDIGREMYIVQSGFVKVLGGKDGKTCLVNLEVGSVFGEISLLGVTGMNRRTADVVSVGFSNLFTLSKEDLQETLRYYPDAKRILNAKARRMMKENEERNSKSGSSSVNNQDEVIFRRRAARKDPALLTTVMQILPPDSMVQQYLRHGSRADTTSVRLLSSLSNTTGIENREQGMQSCTSLQPSVHSPSGSSNNLVSRHNSVQEVSRSSRQSSLSIGEPDLHHNQYNPNRQLSLDQDTKTDQSLSLLKQEIMNVSEELEDEDGHEEDKL